MAVDPANPACGAYCDKQIKGVKIVITIAIKIWYMLFLITCEDKHLKEGTSSLKLYPFVELCNIYLKKADIC